ncbi:ExbD/TolR family protein [Vulgatibacter incomptus]|uniref:Biopolymer transport protein n=1 Tax=Vulgatibacter incomptus TaxID=1391653 RepID=A0A0K1PHR5_9BACT|nr:biopolymer transporter ExbD [Vulgatibacter incomptus]AKU93052.1 Biopolymer transport protein [Vulgatibacter incomptus]
MAGVSVDSGGGSGKKSVDLVIPLVPMIDMLAMMITFLMMTAVWTEIGKLQVAQAPTGPSDSAEPPKPTLQLNLEVTDRGYMLRAGSDAVEIPKKGDGEYDTAKLVEKLKAIKKDNPDQRAITVAAEDSVQYQHLVVVVDKCMEAELPDVSVTAALG